MSEQGCRYPCGCEQFPEEHCACMDGHGATSATDPVVEILAREFYEVVMAATADQWPMWEHADQQTKAGYYDHAYEVREKLPQDGATALREAADAHKGTTATDELWRMWLRERADKEASK